MHSHVACEVKLKGHLFYVEHKSGCATSNQRFILPIIPFPSVANSGAMKRHSNVKCMLIPREKASNYQWFSGSLRSNLTKVKRLQLAGRLQNH